MIDISILMIDILVDEWMEGWAVMLYATYYYKLHLVYR